MADFQWQHFRGEIILGRVRWFCQYGISYRELEEMMVERGRISTELLIYTGRRLIFLHSHGQRGETVLGQSSQRDERFGTPACDQYR